MLGKVVAVLLALIPIQTSAASSSVTVTASIQSYLDLDVTDEYVYWVSNSPEAGVQVSLGEKTVVLTEREHLYTMNEVYSLLQSPVRPQRETFVAISTFRRVHNKL